LRIATRNGAEALGILKHAGTIEVGKRSDLVVLTADPLTAMANTRKIELVFLRPFDTSLSSSSPASRGYAL